ncbi:MAG: DUF4276 family protein [Bacteroidales bacterium]|nr:DUF4276 family protein [Bacteroidales bacterium]
MDILVPKLLGNDITYRILPYRGIGRIPKGLRPQSDASKRILLDQLPKILRGYSHNPHSGIIVIICDLDDKDKEQFLSELHGIKESCAPKLRIFFCLDIEEFEAWYLGDLAAIRKAYPRAKNTVLNNYVSDSICGTWELLADAVYKGGRKELVKKGWQAVGEQKSVWAKTISPHMIVEDNLSPSFKEMHLQLQSTLI